MSHEVDERSGIEPARPKGGIGPRVQYVIAGVIFVLLIALFFTVDTSGHPRESARRAVCSSQLRAIDQSFNRFQNDNHDRLPGYYFQRAEYDPAQPNFHGVTWIGTMGSHDDLRISQSTSANFSPSKSHPCRVFFLMVTAGNSKPGDFVCSSAPEAEDDMKNRGSDCSEGTECVARPGEDRFDFRGYDWLSYGVRLPFGPGPSTRPNTLPSTLVLAADKGPFFEAGGPGLAGTETIEDRPSKTRIPAEFMKMTATELSHIPPDRWRSLNSRNHGSEGQNVLYLDGHVEFKRTPLAGPNGDNIYTFSRNSNNRASAMLGEIPADAPLEGPSSVTDAYIVP